MKSGQRYTTDMFHVKHEIAQSILATAMEASVGVSAERVAVCASMIAWMAPKAAKLGLTQFVDPMAFTRNLVLPGIYLQKFIPQIQCNVAEMGPGNCALGLSVACLRPNNQVYMLDRRSRVTAFAELVTHRFALTNATAVIADMSDPVPPPGPYEFVFARALAETATLFDHLPSFIAPHGHLALIQITDNTPTPANLDLVARQSTNLAELNIDVYQLTY